MPPMRFYVGTHKPTHAARLEYAFISINTLRGRKSPIPGHVVGVDSGAFQEIAQYGHYRHDPDVYAAEIDRLVGISPCIEFAVSQDWMCEPFILEKTGLSIADHQRLTIERYDALSRLVRSVPVMPVLQGYALADYLHHLASYGERITHGMRVGVGSICKRNVNVGEIETILIALRRARPDLRLHGFGIKATSLYSGVVRDCLYSADSMAWSFAARYEGRNPNGVEEAVEFARRIKTMPVQNGWMF